MGEKDMGQGRLRVVWVALACAILVLLKYVNRILTAFARNLGACFQCGFLYSQSLDEGLEDAGFASEDPAPTLGTALSDGRPEHYHRGLHPMSSVNPRKLKKG